MTSPAHPLDDRGWLELPRGSLHSFTTERRIGRNPENNNLVLEEQSVSSRHAIITADPVLSGLTVYNRPGESGPLPVGRLKSNVWGLYDMHGNLQEWTRDNFVRCGSWAARAAACRAAARSQMSREASGSNETGFRLVVRLRIRFPCREGPAPPLTPAPAWR